MSKSSLPLIALLPLSAWAAHAGRTFVTDAGGNTLLEVRANGDVSLLATFDPIPVPPGPFNPPFAQAEPVPPRSPAARTGRSTSAC